jgi:glutathione S-transferase
MFFAMVLWRVGRSRGGIVTTDMRLYGSTIPSGNVYKVQLLLGQLGVRHDTEELDILATPSETRRPEFLAKNGNGRVPVLELDDGTCLAESNAILFYLAEGTPFLPESRLGRARVLQWLFFEQYSHEPYVAVLKFWTYWGGLDRCRAEDIERWKTRGQAALEVMGRHLADHQFFVTERYTIADIALFAYTQSAAAVGYAVPASVDAWMDRVRAQPAFVAIRLPAAESLDLR